MNPDDTTSDDAGPAFGIDEMKNLWPQTRGELLGLARSMDRGRAGITAAQIRLAVRMADNYLKGLNTAPTG